MVIDVTESDFAAEVVERSRSQLVVVDFWAGWCAPCRVLGPVLEDAVAARAPEVVLAKVDVDRNPGLQARFGIRGIPAVKAFRDGAVVAEFTGALPRPQVVRWLDALLPTAADRLAAAGDEASLRRAIEADPDHAAARVSLARLLLARGDGDEVVGLLTPVEHDALAGGLLARLRLAELVNGSDGAAAAALRALDAGDPARALDRLVELVRAGGDTRELARRTAVGVFSELGEDDPLTREFRPKLAAALY